MNFIRTYRIYIMAALFAIAFTTLLWPMVANNDYMSPVIENGDIVFISRLDYNDNRPPQKGDIVAFKENIYYNEPYAPKKENRIKQVKEVKGTKIILENTEYNKENPLYINMLRGKVVFRVWPLNKFGFID